MIIENTLNMSSIVLYIKFKLLCTLHAYLKVLRPFYFRKPSLKIFFSKPLQIYNVCLISISLSIYFFVKLEKHIYFKEILLSKIILGTIETITQILFVNLYYLLQFFKSFYYSPVNQSRLE